MEKYLKYLKCCHCLQLYEDAYELFCGHSFCKKCIDNDLKNQEEVCCDVCPTLSKYEDMKLNFRINEFVRFLKPLHTDNSSQICCIICDKIIEPQDVYLCKVCEDYFCLICSINHGNGKKTRHHNVLSLSNEPVPYCKNHMEKLKYYCNEDACKKMLCMSCAITLHDHHDKQTIEDRKKDLETEISDIIRRINLRINELQSHKKFSINYKEDIEQQFKDLQTKARERRDYVVNQANEAYKKQVDDMDESKFEILNKIDENIETIEFSEKNMTAILKYTKEYLNGKSYPVIDEIYTEVGDVLKTECDINFSFVEIEKLQLIPINFDEDSVQKNIHSYIGKISINVEEQNTSILSCNKSLFYEKVIQPQLVTITKSSEEGLTDILYDHENGDILSLQTIKNEENLVKISKNGDINKFVLENISYGYRRKYLALLPNHNILVLVYSDKDTADQIIEVNNDLTDSREFPISFCEVKNLRIICSSPCNEYVLFLSPKLLKIFKYCVHTKQYEMASLPETWKNCYISYMSLSGNLDNIAFGNFQSIQLFSFKNESVLRTFGKSECYYRGVSFLTENILIAGLADCSLNIFDSTTGKLLRKIKRIKEEANDYEIKEEPHLVYAYNDSNVIFNQGLNIIKIALY